MKHQAKEPQSSTVSYYDKNARVAGILFLLGFAGGISAALLHPITESENVMQAFLSNSVGIQISSLGIFIMGFACTGIAIALYPSLKPKDKSIALGAVIFRSIEGILHILVGVMYLGMLVVAQQSDAALGPIMTIFLGTIEAVVLSATIAWGIGAICYCFIFFLRKLIPSWLALWGLVGMSLSLSMAICGFFCGGSANSAVSTVLNIPIALQELVLAGWLIIKGLKHPVDWASQ